MKTKILMLVTLMVLLAGLVAVPAQANANSDPIEASIQAGIAWLVGQQNGDGSWGTGGISTDAIGTTGLVLVKLQDRAFELGYNGPFDAAYPYKVNVEAGLNYILTYAGGVGITPQPAGNPDTDGDWLGVSVNSHRIYDTGITMMAIAAGRDPARVVTTGPLGGGGWTYGMVLQDMADFMAWGQSDTGYGQGGWWYSPVVNGGGADQSNSGYALLGLLYAQSPLYGYECNIPGFVASELNTWINHIQNAVDGDSYDGGSGYQYPWSWVNSLKTGNLLTQMAFYGDAPSATRVQDALNYLARHWNGTWTQGWGKGGPSVQYQATYCIMKGLETMGIPDNGLDGRGGLTLADWYLDMAAAIIAGQNGDGSWPSSPAYVSDSGTPYHYVSLELSTVWALLMLERFSPPPLNKIEVEKDYRYTNVCFEKDNDKDGSFNEDPVDFDITGLPIDNDGDGLYNEDDVDCALGTYLGDLLPPGESPDEVDTYEVEAVVAKNGKVRSYNPGQYYAASTINVLADVDSLTIEELFEECTECGSDISDLNPKKGGGSVVVVQVGPDDPDEIAYQILDAKGIDNDGDGLLNEDPVDGVDNDGDLAIDEDPAEVTIAYDDCGNGADVPIKATVELGPVEAGTTIIVYVKFVPALKHMDWSVEADCLNYNSAWYDDQDRVLPPEDNIATARLRVVQKMME